MIEQIPFGKTGHASTRTLFGAAGLGRMSQERADRVLALLLEHGVNHIDTAASYGDSELRIAPWLQSHPGRFFLATKTGERSYEGARRSIERSLARLGVDQIDMIQFHNLTLPNDWDTVMSRDGALRAAVEAREAGRVRFIGVTGHGTFAAAMHRKSLEHFPFDSVLLPYSFTMMQQPDYAADFEALYELCTERGVAMQTIKSVARRRWTEPQSPRFSWYEPLRDPSALERAVHFVIARPNLFLNTSSDATLLPAILEAASRSVELPSDELLAADARRFEMEPLFVRGVSDQI